MCSDKSPLFISGVEKFFPNAHLTFDKFHIMKVINEAVDEVRRQEQKDRLELFRTRYIRLKNIENLNLSQSEILDELTVKKLNLKTNRATISLLEIIVIVIYTYSRKLDFGLPT